MSKFIIGPHMRLHEWIAEDKGYFEEEGLDYEFREQLDSTDAKKQNLGDKVGAYQTFERGRTCDVSSACHWTVNMAAGAGHAGVAEAVGLRAQAQRQQRAHPALEHGGGSEPADRRERECATDRSTPAVRSGRRELPYFSIQEALKR